jgi:hypothetical protein
MSTTEQDLIRRTYDAFMWGRKTRDADGCRAKLRALKIEAGDQWDAIRNAAIAFDVKANG